MARLSSDQIALIKTKLDQDGALPEEWRWILFPPEKREHELVYADKEREEDILARAMGVPLQNVRTFNNGPAGPEPGKWYNRLIFGDNLQAMKSLLDDPTVAGKVKLVYIDPPFATKQEFQGNREQKGYHDKVKGAEFIEFLRKRLVLIRSLLAPDGSIYVHLDWRKAHYLRAILDEVFDENRFQNQIIWQRHDPHNDAKTRYGRIHDTLYWYSMNDQPIYNFEEITEGLSAAAVKEYSLVQLEDGTITDWDPSYEDLAREGKARRFKLDDCTVKGRNKDRQFVWRGAKPSAKRVWPADSPKAMDELVRKGVLYLRNPEKGAARCRVSFLDRRLEEGVLAQDIWLNLGRMKGGSSYPTEKPELLLERIIRASSNEGDLVLDAFAGSGTTLAVAEKLGRRWIGIDCGKLSMYTIQQRMMNLRAEIGNKGPALRAHPFMLQHAGLYDFQSLRDLPWPDWKFFALQLFECKPKPHKIGGLDLDGEKADAPVLVFDWKNTPGRIISEETIADIHGMVGRRIGKRFYIIAPMMAFDFFQDYIDLDGVRYYALRIPYDVIAELHRRDFKSVLQARNASNVNDIQEAYGFSFMVAPEVSWSASLEHDEAGQPAFVALHTTKFVSRVRIKGEDRRGGLETLAMLMVDPDYDGRVFNLGTVSYGGELQDAEGTIRLPVGQIGDRLMTVWIDHHGNEAKVVIDRAQFGLAPLGHAVRTATRRRTAAPPAAAPAKTTKRASKLTNKPTGAKKSARPRGGAGIKGPGRGAKPARGTTRTRGRRS